MPGLFRSAISRWENGVHKQWNSYYVAFDLQTARRSFRNDIEPYHCNREASRCPGNTPNDSKSAANAIRWGVRKSNRPLVKVILNITVPQSVALAGTPYHNNNNYKNNRCSVK